MRHGRLSTNVAARTRTANTAELERIVLDHREIFLVRFNSRYLINATSDCWMWAGNQTRLLPKRMAYGRLPVGYGYILAHRISWILNIGPIPHGLCVCHKCDVPLCVNPDHLFLGTIGDNNRDMSHKGRHWKPPGRDWSGDNAPMRNPSIRAKIAATKALRGSGVGERHPSAILTNVQVVTIRHIIDTGQKSTADVAKQFGVSRTTIDDIKRRRTWVHLLPDDKED